MMLNVDVNTVIVVIGFMFTIASVVWSIAGIERKLDVRLSIVETEVKFLTGNNKRNTDNKG